MRVKGKVVRTILRGEVAFMEDEVVAVPGSGINLRQIPFVANRKRLNSEGGVGGGLHQSPLKSPMQKHVNTDVFFFRFFVGLLLFLWFSLFCLILIFFLHLVMSYFLFWVVWP